MALRQPAVRLGADMVSPVSYDHARSLILAAAARSRAPGADRDLMPTLDQIEGLLTTHKLTWAEACRRAGLNRPTRGQAAARVQAMDAE